MIEKEKGVIRLLFFCSRTTYKSIFMLLFFSTSGPNRKITLDIADYIHTAKLHVPLLKGDSAL